MSQFTNAWHSLFKESTENFNKKYAVSHKTRKNRKNRRNTRKHRRNMRR